MSRRARRNHTPAFKKVGLAGVKGDRTLAQLAEQFDVHPNQITAWKAQLEGSAAAVVGPGIERVDPVLQQLPRLAGAQRASSNVKSLTGPSPIARSRPPRS